MVGGRLYLNAPTSVGAALDARTGETLWVYNPKSYEKGTTTMSARWNQRGVAYWTDGKEERVYWGTGDGYLLAVDAKTGIPVPSFGEQGRVDLMQGLPRAERGARDWLNALTYSVQSPPIVIRDTIVTPASISSLNVLKEQIPGWTRGYDVRTGKLQVDVPHGSAPGEFGNETWEDDSWSLHGQGDGWTMFSADEELGYLYVPFNTAAPDYYGGHRPGDNLFAESARVPRRRHRQARLALPVRAPRPVGLRPSGRAEPARHHGRRQAHQGRRADHQAGVRLHVRSRHRPADLADRGAPGAAVRRAGRARRRRRSRFRPSRRRSNTRASTIDDLVDFTPEIRAMAVQAVKNFRIGPLFTPPSLVQRARRGSRAAERERRRELVGRRGRSRAGHPLRAVAEPDRSSRLTRRDPELKSTLRFMEVRGAACPSMPQGLPLFKPPYSRMTAIDMNTGEHLWMVPLGERRQRAQHPRLEGLNLPPVGGDSTMSGPLLTKTLLISALTRAARNGGPRLVARDKATGREIASVDLPGPAIGTPMTYALDGKQYIALTVNARAEASAGARRARAAVEAETTKGAKVTTKDTRNCFCPTVSKHPHGTVPLLTCLASLTLAGCAARGTIAAGRRRARRRPAPCCARAATPA